MRRGHVVMSAAAQSSHAGGRGEIQQLCPAILGDPDPIQLKRRGQRLILDGRVEFLRQIRQPEVHALPARWGPWSSSVSGWPVRAS